MSDRYVTQRIEAPALCYWAAMSRHYHWYRRNEGSLAWMHTDAVKVRYVTRIATLPIHFLVSLVHHWDGHSCGDEERYQIHEGSQLWREYHAP